MVKKTKKASTKKTSTSSTGKKSKLKRQNTVPTKNSKSAKKGASDKKVKAKASKSTKAEAKAQKTEDKKLTGKNDTKKGKGEAKKTAPKKSPRVKILEDWNAKYESNKAVVEGSLSMWYWDEVRSYLSLLDLIQTRCLSKQFHDVSSFALDILPEHVTDDPQYTLEFIDEEEERWTLPANLISKIHIRSLSVQQKFYYPLFIASLETIVTLRLDSVEEDAFVCPKMPNLRRLEMQNCTMNIEIAILTAVSPFIETLILDPDNLFEDDVPTRSFEEFEFPNLNYLHTSLSLILDFAKIPQLRSIHVAGEASFRNQFLNKIEEIEWSERNCTNWSSEFTTHLKSIELNIRLDEQHFLLPIVLDCLHKPGISLQLKISYDITELWIRMDPNGLYVIDCDLEDENEDDQEVHAAFTKFLGELVRCHPNPNMSVSFNQQSLGGQRAFTQRIVLVWLESTGMLQSTIMFTKIKTVLDDELEDISYE